MANSEGGTIVLGARENEAGRVVLDGLSSEQTAKYQKNLWDCLHDRHKVSANLLATGDIKVESIDGTQLLVVAVPRAPRRERPVYLGPNPLSGTFRREHEGDYRCSDAEVRRMLSDAAEEARDARRLEHFTLDDLDAASLEQYRRLFQLRQEGHPWLKLPEVEFLAKLGGWCHDRATGKQGPTLAALLMFGKELAIRDPEAAPDYFVDYREKLDATTRWSDRVHPDGTWEANLFQFYGRVWPKVAHALPVPFQLEGDTRKDETPAHEALREATPSPAPKRSTPEVPDPHGGEALADPSVPRCDQPSRPGLHQGHHPTAAMKLQFDGNQPFQLAAVHAVVDLSVANHAAPRPTPCCASRTSAS